MGNEALSNIVKTTYFTRENAHFIDKDGLLALKIPAEENGEEKEYGRVFLHRMFPFEETERYLSVLDEEQKELGIITDPVSYTHLGPQMVVRSVRRGNEAAQ